MEGGCRGDDFAGAIRCGALGVCRRWITLFSDLQLGAAIRLAWEMARDEHQRLGRQVRVETPRPISAIVRARYADGGDESNAADALAA